ncbi:MAG: endonuclease/exonuclease/phosphatase family protein, partial [Flavobacteriaceae bacterium]
ATPSIIGEMQIGNVPLTVVAVHPEPPMNIPDIASRIEQFSNMREQRQEWSENTILLGDLNTASFSLQFTDLTEKLRLRDSRKGFGILPTWPTNTWPLMTTLDHILIGGNLQVLDRMVGKHVGSDHLPVYAVLGL